MRRRKPAQPYPPAPRSRRAAAKVAEPVLAPAAPSSIAAGLFKARCLELMDRVQAEGGEIVITKHGKPVAKLVPVTAPAPQGFGALRVTVRRYGDLISPVDAAWEADGG